MVHGRSYTQKGDEDYVAEVRPPVGGLQTKFRAPIVQEGQSPDLLNVLFDKKSVRRREGCVPINRYLPGKNSLRNRGLQYLGKVANTTPLNTRFKVVPGHGFIGHRPHFNDYNSLDAGVTTSRLTVSFLVTPEPGGDDPSEMIPGPNGETASAEELWFKYNENSAQTARQTYSYRPILSKGPLRGTRFLDANNDGVPEEALPFSIFVYNGSGNDIRWGVYISQAINGATGDSPTLLTSTASGVNDSLGQPNVTNPRPLHTYRLTLSVTANSAAGGTARLTVTELRGDGTIIRNVYTTALTRELWTNSGPIQLFDMPRAIIEAPVVQGGLAIGAGYWRTVLRFEGKLQDVSFWSVDKTGNGADFTFAESMTPLDLTQANAGLLGYWAPDPQSNRAAVTWEEDKVVIPESRGIDAPIMLGPNVPTWQRVNGKPGLYFDGRTAYALLPTSMGTTYPGGAGGTLNPAYNTLYVGNGFDSLVHGALVPNGQHSISMTFIPDSIEARSAGAEAKAQTLLAWKGVLELAISNRGNIYWGPYDGAGAIALFTATAVTPGQRYTLLYRRQSQNTADLYLNGVQIATTGALVAFPATIAGGLPCAVIGTDGGAGVTPEFIGLSDIDTHFVGRIEDIRIAGGVLDPQEGLQRDLVLSDLQLGSARLWATTGGSATVSAVTVLDQLTKGGVISTGGWWLLAPGCTASLSHPPFHTPTLIRPMLIKVAATGTTLTLAAVATGQPDGFNTVTQQYAFCTQCLAWWNFEQNCLTTNQESRYRGSREASDATVRVYQQLYAENDRVGCSIGLILRSREPDIQAVINGTVVFSWLESTPQEVIPRFAAGLVPALPSDNPVTLIAPFRKTDGGFYPIVAAATSLYWLKPPWEKDGPYPKAVEPSPTCLFGSGRFKNHIEFAANTKWNMNASGLTLEFWAKVPELGRVREVFLNWAGTADLFNLRVLIGADGAILVDGYAAAAYWQVRTSAVATQPIRAGVWQFVTITIHGTTIANDRIYVNGQSQTLTTVGAHAAAWDGGTGKKWVAGHPHDLGVAATAEPNMPLPLFGDLRDFRISLGQRYLSTVLDFPPPTATLAVDAATITLIPFTDGSDLLATSVPGTVPATALTAHGNIRNPELLPILEGSLLGSHSSAAYPYDWNVYLDALYVTNGLGPPLAIRFTGLKSDLAKRGAIIERPLPWGFAVSRMGITPPGKDPPNMVGKADSAGGIFIQATYLIAVTFVSEDGLESDPITYTGDPGAPVNKWTYLDLVGLPRSLEPHVVTRNVYLGQVAALLSNRPEKTTDNFTDEVEISSIPIGRSVDFTNGAPPPARFISASRGRTYLVETNSQNVSLSEPLRPESHSRSLTAIDEIGLPSPAGSFATFVKEHQSRLFTGKRDSIFNLVPGQDITNFISQRINTSKGFISGHSVVSWEDHLFGLCQKGVHAFDGSSLEYIAESLEGLWSQVDISPDGTLLQHGIFHDPTNQYWLSFRRTGERFGREIVVFDTIIRDEKTGRCPWSLLKTVRHSYMESVNDGSSFEPHIYLGTPEGQVFLLLAGGVDGSRQLKDPSSASVTILSGTATGGSTTTLTHAGPFDTLGHGLRGLWATVTHANGTREEARILTNPGTALTFESPLAAPVANGDTFVVGAFDAYWTSAWLPLTRFSQAKLTRSVDIDFAPQAGTLEVRVLEGGNATILADAFDYDGVPNNDSFRFVISDTSTGYMTETIHLATRSPFWRIYVGTRGINAPFEMFGFAVAFSEEGLRKGRF